MMRYHRAMEVVTASGLVKDFRGIRAVDSIDFTIRQGECFGFLGPNGAGKTTTMRVVSCAIEPTAGSVSVFGEDVRSSASAIKARLGVMPQENNLDPDLSVIENLFVYARYFDIPKRRSLPLSDRLLEFVELTDKRNARITELSGGMKRRLVLARSLINDPDMILLDEPTTGLDPHSRRATWDKVRALKKQGKTFVLTTHYMEEADHLCDRVAIMDQGRIKTIDTPARLKEAHGGHLEDVYLALTGRNLAD